MTFWLALGCFSATYSSAAVLFAMVVARSPELVLLMLAAAFIWLIGITIVASVWVAAAPAREQLWLLLLYAVPIQEACRWLTYQAYVALLQGLERAQLLPAPLAHRQLTPGAHHPTNTPAPDVLHTDRATPGADITLPAAVAAGLGVGLTQTVVLYGDVLWHSSQPGSLYNDACASLSVFAVRLPVRACHPLLPRCLARPRTTHYSAQNIAEKR